MTMTSPVTDRSDAAMIAHAKARGAVNTREGLSTLIGWSPHSTRCLVVRGDDEPRHYRPHKAEVFPVICGVCGAPAHPDCVRYGLRLCVPCARTEMEATR